MKLLKKILWVGATLSALAGLSLTAISCNKKGDKNDSSTDSSGAGDSTSYVYRVSLQNETGFGFAGATVNLMDGDEIVASKQTNLAGNANFSADEIDVGKYTISITDTPNGYEFTNPEREYQTAEFAGTQTVVNVKPMGVIDEEAPMGTYYKLGDVVHDFTVNLSTGETYTLSEVLEEKKLVLINFWATWCTPCKSEFSAMNSAIKAYEANVSALTISTTDTLTEAQGYMDGEGYALFNVGSVASDTNAAKLYGSLDLKQGIPQSVLIDRYGVVVFNHVGSMPSTSEFTSRFERFVGEDYRPTILGSNVSEDDSSNDSTNNRIEPTVAAPKISDLKAALTTEDFTFRFQEEEGVQPDEENYDKYNWPWSISEDKSYIYASNVGVDNSYAILYSTYTAKEGDVLTFDYKVGSELDCDIFYVMLDGEIIKKYSGDHKDDWQTSYAYVFRDYEEGKHEISFVFLKDSGTKAHEDIVHIKNLRILNVDDLEGSAEDITIFRQAATNPTTDKNANKQFQNYVDVVYNEKDEYYHVGSANGPVLYANMMNATPWNNYGLWTLAYSDYVVGDGMNFKGAIEDFAWEAAQVTTVNGYTPVTEDLRYLLDATVRYVSFGEKFAGKYQDGKESEDYHSKEWLELCVYWEDYGQPDKFEDPMAGITFTAAIPLYAGTPEQPYDNLVHVPYKINPRGFKYKFTPTAEEAGAYRVYSVGDKDPIVFLVDEDRKSQLGYFDNKVFADAKDDNFEFYWYFEAGKTYYLLFTTYLDELTSYNVRLEHLGESHIYKENAAVGPYSANLNTFELFLPDAIAYEYADPANTYFYRDDNMTAIGDGYYHYKYTDGSLGGKIYLDLNRPTAFFDTASLHDIYVEGLKSADGTPALYVEEQYIDGKYVAAKDYAIEFQKLWLEATRNMTEVKADTPVYVAVNKDIYDMLYIVTRCSKYEGIEDTWLLLCYYDRKLG